MDNEFTLQIGDWSGDGHGHHKDFSVTSNKPVSDVREAWFAAKKKHPRWCPDKYAHRYERTITETEYDMLVDAGAPLHKRSPEGWLKFGPEEMASVVVWYCMLGDPGLKLEIQPASKRDTFAFYGFDDQGRHIDFIGYGLFGG